MNLFIIRLKNKFNIQQESADSALRPDSSPILLYNNIHFFNTGNLLGSIR